MFEIGIWELVMVGVVALLVVGPERLPGLARTAGLWLGKARRMLAEVKAEVDKELQLDELKQSLRQQVDQNGLNDLSDRVNALRHDIQAEFDDPGPPPGWHPGMPTAQLPAGTPPQGSSPEPQPSALVTSGSDPVQLRKSALMPTVSSTVAAPTPPPSDRTL